MRVFTAITMLVLTPFCMGGCLYGRPGIETQQAMKQKQQTGWDEHGNFNRIAEGTHTDNVLMAEGEIVMTNVEGEGLPEIDWANSRITHVLITKPEADDAYNAANAFAAASTAQAELFGKHMESMTSIITSFLPTVLPPPRAPPVDDGDDTSRLERIIDELRRRGVEIPMPIEEGGDP